MPALALSALLAIPGIAAAQDVLRIGLVLPGAETPQEVGESVRLGAELGAEEAQRLAGLLGKQVELVTGRAGDASEAVALAGRMMERDGVFALVGGFDEATCRALSEVARGRALFLNIGCSGDELRRELCTPTTFHVGASDAMYRQVRQAGPGDPALWHHSLYRYGASQLNERFEDRFGRPMDSPSWAAWLAVKLLTESALRARTTTPPELVRHLEAERTQFDGHKGRSLSFRRWDHQLRQPLYLVATRTADDGTHESSVVAELPEGRPAPGQSTQDFLDQIGDPANARGGCGASPTAAVR